MKFTDQESDGTVSDTANSCCLRRAEEVWALDDITVAIVQGRTVKTEAFDKLPPWRAVLYAELCEAAGAPIEHGDLEQMKRAAAEAGAYAEPGWWRAALGLEPIPAVTQQLRQPYVPPTGWKVVRTPNGGKH